MEFEAFAVRIIWHAGRSMCCVTDCDWVLTLKIGDRVQDGCGLWGRESGMLSAIQNSKV